MKIDGADHFGQDWLPVVYDDLRSLAAAHLNGERSGHTLCATDLVHEAWLRFRGYQDTTLKGHAHFLALASQAMRRVLIDHARRRLSAKRGGGVLCVELSEQLDVSTPEQYLELDLALIQLAEIDPEIAGMVEMRYFGGATTEEIALTFGVSERTVRHRMAYARSWLHGALS